MIDLLPDDEHVRLTDVANELNLEPRILLAVIKDRQMVKIFFQDCAVIDYLGERQPDGSYYVFKYFSSLLCSPDTLVEKFSPPVRPTDRVEKYRRKDFEFIGDSYIPLTPEEINRIEKNGILTVKNEYKKFIFDSPEEGLVTRRTWKPDFLKSRSSREDEQLLIKNFTIENLFISVFDVKALREEIKNCDHVKAIQKSPEAKEVGQEIGKIDESLMSLPPTIVAAGKDKIEKTLGCTWNTCKKRMREFSAPEPGNGEKWCLPSHIYIDIIKKYPPKKK